MHPSSLTTNQAGADASSARRAKPAAKRNHASTAMVIPTRERSEPGGIRFCSSLDDTPDQRA